MPIIAIIGSDGRGKTTTGSALLDWMRQHRRVAFCHLGKQTGSLGWIIACLPFVGSCADRHISHTTEQTRLEGRTRFSPALIIFAFSMRRVLRFRRMLRLHNKGIIVLTDRYPQIALPGGLDSPALTFSPENGSVVHMLTALERRLYAWMTHYKPDLVIRLNVDLETAASRKPDHKRSTLARKITDVPILSFEEAPIAACPGGALPVRRFHAHAEAIGSPSKSRSRTASPLNELTRPLLQLPEPAPEDRHSMLAPSPSIKMVNHNAPSVSSQRFRVQWRRSD